jgi:cytosine deaminase
MPAWSGTRASRPTSASTRAHRRHQPKLAAEGETSTSAGRLVTPGFIETHIHLDKSRILGRCKAEKGDLEEAIGEVAQAEEAVHGRGRLRARQGHAGEGILNGTTHMRTQLEVDPGIGLRGLEGVRPLIEEYKWAIDLEICIFPQEGLLNNPGTDELMIQALEGGGSVVGAAPYTTRARTARSTASRDCPRVRHRHRHAPRLRADA